MSSRSCISRFHAHVTHRYQVDISRNERIYKRTIHGHHRPSDPVHAARNPSQNSARRRVGTNATNRGTSRRRTRISTGVLIHEENLAETRRHVRPRCRVLGIGPDAHSAVRFDAIPTVDIRLPHRSPYWRTARQLLKVGPRESRSQGSTRCRCLLAHSACLGALWRS